MVLWPLLPLNSSFPASKKRLKKLDECEKALSEFHNRLTVDMDSELKDAIHYTLFRLKDRFSMSTAILIAEDLKIPSTQILPVFSALEMLRCALGTVTQNFTKTREKNEPQYIDPHLSQQAVVCLISMAATLALNPEINNEFTETERLNIAQLFSTTLSPLKIFTDFNQRNKRSNTRIETLEQILKFPNPIWQSLGYVFDIVLASRTQDHDERSPYALFFNEVGAYSQLIEGHLKKEPSARMLDIIKTLETRLLDQSKELEIEKAMSEVINPLSKLFQSQYQ